MTRVFHSFSSSSSKEAQRPSELGTALSRVLMAGLCAQSAAERQLGRDSCSAIRACAGVLCVPLLPTNCTAWPVSLKVNLHLRECSKANPALSFGPKYATLPEGYYTA